MRLIKVKDNNFVLEYLGKQVNVMLNHSDDIQTNDRLYSSLYDLVQDCLYLNYQIEEGMYADKNDLSRMIENRKILCSAFTTEELAELENKVDEMEYAC